MKGIGSKATGALAVGAVAIGALAIGRLAVGRARIRHFPEDLPVSVIPPEDMDPEEFLTNRARGDLEKLSARIGQPGATLEVVVSTHSARREIVKYAQGHGIDLIIMGSYSKDGILGRAGSTANSVMRTANIDVLVVHPTE